ncbi:MAG: hypothetical protein ACR2FS_11230 [Phormidesmis sp.]
MTYGLAPSPTAALEEFNDLPDGKKAEDVYVFGLFDAENVLAGMILGADFYRAFERWVSAQGISQTSLSAIAANKSGLQLWKQMGFKVIRKIPSRQFKAKTHSVYVLGYAIS